MGDRTGQGAVRRLLFVCTGNTCRSPLAEALARESAGARGLSDLECRSAGTHASRDAPASSGSVEVADEVGVELSSHRSTPLGEELLGWADLVVCMSVSHRLVVERMGAGERAVLLTRFLPEEHPEHGRSVADPVGRELETYREVRELMKEAVDGLLDHVEATRSGGPGGGGG